ncbi:TniB family NTP-binding protein [Nucisporomicrobium flavum]|uniref:TniB family NTP-binding protein n=1 Tax=Nucisporomicrobium flavum TaxID=2785915 RepID=UPI0018F4084C|nr:TniB family NTP-binding protein [Nucisporomicrobium flavum]
MGAEVREDFNEARHDHHSALVIVKTPVMKRVHARIAEKMRANKHQTTGPRRGFVLDGQPTVGKSTLVKTFGAKFELTLRRRYPERFSSQYVQDGRLIDYTPFVLVGLQSNTTPKNLSLAIAHWFNQPFRSAVTESEATEKVIEILNACGTELIVVDEYHFLNMESKEGKSVNNHIKHLSNYCPATFVFAGHDLRSSGMFLEGFAKRRPTQTSMRNSYHNIGPFQVNTVAHQRQWASVINEMEHALTLFKHESGSLATQHWRYMHDRTGGSIASLSELIRLAAGRAIDDGSEKITRNMLDTIEIDVYSMEAYRQLTKSQSGQARKRAQSGHLQVS